MKIFTTRIFIFLLSFIYSIAVQAQQKEPFDPSRIPVEESTKLITYLEVAQIPGTTAKELYKRGISWFNAYYKNPTDVIRKTDTIQGTIDGKARIKIYNPPDKTGLRTNAGNVEYSISLGCKDGRFRYKITDINWKQPSYYPVERWMDTKSKTYTPNYLYYLEQTDSLIHEVKRNVESFIKKAPPVKKDDW